MSSLVMRANLFIASMVVAYIAISISAFGM